MTFGKEYAHTLVSAGAGFFVAFLGTVGILYLAKTAAEKQVQASAK